MKRRPALFLDRDGTLVDDDGYMTRPSQLRLLRNAVNGVRRILELGFVPIVVTNQSGVSRGYFTRADLERMNRRLASMLRARGIRLAAIYACPHQESDGCSCRKPEPGMLKRAAREHGLDLKRSVIIGDSARDVGAGRAVGALTIQVRSREPASRLKPDYRAGDLLDAARWLERRLLK